MKRMIDNKEFNEIKKDIEDHASDYIITDVVTADEQVDGFIIKDVKNEITYNIVLGGGGKQLYQHNVMMKFVNASNYKIMQLQIINDSNNQLTKNDVLTWLHTNGYDKTDSDGITKRYGYTCNGMDNYSGSYASNIYAINYANSEAFYILTTDGNSISGNSVALSGITEIIDTVITL